MATTWRLVHDQAIECRHWDGEWVVYNKLTSDLHIVDSKAIVLLRELKHRPADAATLAAAFCRTSASAADGLLPEIEAVLEEMHSCSLVEPV